MCDLAVGRLDDLGRFPDCLVPDDLAQVPLPSDEHPVGHLRRPRPHLALPGVAAAMT